MGTPGYPLLASEFYMGRDVQYPPTDEMRSNAEALLSAVNQLLAEYIADTGNTCHGLSSGYRPAAVNAQVPHAATHSAHMSCQAVDVHDPDRKLTGWLLHHLEILEKYGLYLESPSATPTWAHLQTRPTLHRVFTP